MSIRDLNQYEIIKDEDLQDVKCHGYLLNTAGGQHRTSAYSGAFGTVWI